ncbi:fibroblast growth factor 6-like isoform X2 [Gouania willdenowi]|uniref:fibroblast growth factor 6-like isoform X2 n=1 Tax=Gouania willdenowi TaxID=441366 RepID=UPI001054ABE3|nr:fibroblast growth factor 6-like isoform X2 [Gouania willdenowi]XP_028304563.1 fibroblast growth factor 6-like isoform X2 [Gouania willdenowi]
MSWTHWIVLWSLWTCACGGITSSFPLPFRNNNRNNATVLEKKWETLFSRSYLGISGRESELNWESDYLQGIKRVRRLYCNIGIGFHLQVLPDGRISGTHSENQHSLIEISTVDRGVISLFGMKSELFVAMNAKGRLYGTSCFMSPAVKAEAAFEKGISFATTCLLLLFPLRVRRPTGPPPK